MPAVDWSGGVLKNRRPRRYPASAHKEVKVDTDTCTCEDRRDTLSERVLLEIRRRLDAAGYHVLRQIECDYFNGVIVLRGCVPTYYVKQIAQAVLLTSPIVEKVVNLIDVSENGRRTTRQKIA
jgi:hypothetical protein